ncbi:MAG TPA: HPF/RaiA family ribosome-associated protein [Polyangiaceae bacterium]|nr:HPF/RaiA family ribosome-associated protein [Polyangiaceae bacterium]
MQIQVNTDHNVDGRQRVSEYVQGVVQHAVSHFERQVTRVEVHLSDDNGAKSGSEDKRCVMEARLNSIEPVVVSHRGHNIDEALHGAAAKLKRSVESELARARSHR